MAVHVDDIQPVLNPVLASDLQEILRMTPYERRVDVALAFANLRQLDLANRTDIDRTTVFRWLSRENKMPFGAAIRFARVFGVDPMTLFWYYLDDIGLNAPRKAAVVGA